MIHKTCCDPMHSATQPHKATGDWIPPTEKTNVRIVVMQHHLHRNNSYIRIFVSRCSQKTCIDHLAEFALFMRARTLQHIMGSEPRQKGLRDRNSPTCTLSQNGYGTKHTSQKEYRLFCDTSLLSTAQTCRWNIVPMLHYML